ncbi:hypothetical protein C8F04DRAFT_1062578 [Mycena alexandri]|uniref:Uncharacterized protein n=1 Tax=Mycena alexandri TaxID=1745969 RepID=A0AAD6TIR6_9AGAR|nr:hypothetical protein C8F04DRAFT_1062578 [Mycena alexandri]
MGSGKKAPRMLARTCWKVTRVGVRVSSWGCGSSRRRARMGCVLEEDEVDDEEEGEGGTRARGAIASGVNGKSVRAVGFIFKNKITSGTRLTRFRRKSTTAAAASFCLISRTRSASSVAARWESLCLLFSAAQRLRSSVNLRASDSHSGHRLPAAPDRSRRLGVCRAARTGERIVEASKGMEYASKPSSCQVTCKLSSRTFARWMPSSAEGMWTWSLRVGGGEEEKRR